MTTPVSPNDTAALHPITDAIAMVGNLTIIDDPLIADLVRLLNDPRLSDALAESVRAQPGEIVYQLRVVIGEVAA